MITAANLRRRAAQRDALASAASFAAIIGLAAIIRLWQIDLVEFKLDESGWLSVASGLIDQGKLPQIGSVDANTRNTMGIHLPPLMAYVMALPLLFSRNPAFATAFVALMNVAAVALVYVFGIRYFGRLEGQTAALLYAASTTAILYSRKIWSNFVLAPFVVLFFIALAALFVERKRWNLAVALFLLSWVLQLHISTLPLAFVLLILALLFRREIGWRLALIGIVGGLILWIPYVLWIVQNNADDVSVVLSFASSGAAAVDLTGIRNVVEMITTGSTEVGVSVRAPGWIPSTGGFIWFDYLYVILLAAGLVLAVRRASRPSHDPASRKAHLVLLLWVALPILVSIRHSISVQRFYMLPLQPALFVLMGISFAATVKLLLRRSSAAVGSGDRSWLWRVVLSFAFLAVLAAVASQAYLFTQFVSWADDGNAIKAFGYPPARYEMEAAAHVSSSPTTGQPVVMVPDDVDTAKVFYYVLASRMPRFEEYTSQDTLLLPYGAKDSVYLVPGSRSDLIRQVQATVPDAKWERVEDGGHELQFLVGKGVQDSLERLTKGFKSTEIDLANGLRITGYQLPSRLEGSRPLIGYLALEMVRRIEANDGADYHLFNHFVDLSGNKVAQRDSSSLPLREWQPGDAHIFAFAIDLPAETPSGAHRWTVGVYDLHTMKRVAMRDGVTGKTSDSVDLGQFLLTEGTATGPGR